MDSFFSSTLHISLHSFAALVFPGWEGQFKGHKRVAYLLSVGQDQAKREMIQAVGDGSPGSVSAHESL